MCMLRSLCISVCNILEYQKEAHTVEDLDACLAASLSLTLPGRVLCMSALIQLKKFRNCGTNLEA